MKLFGKNLKTFYFEDENQKYLRVLYLKIINSRYEGRHCEINKNDCLPLNPCLNGGTCHDRVGSYHCECPPGKTGLVCHLDDACASNPCQAPNAICETSVINGSYKCRCPVGYTGHNCDEDINECEEGKDIKMFLIKIILLLKK